MAVRWGAEASGNGKVVPLGALLKGTRQGVIAARLDAGDIAIEIAGVTDVQQVVPGAGERRFVSPLVLRRHVVETGDVLVARVGRHGYASCIWSGAPPIVPREGVFVVRPKQREWGPVLAAALCTPTVRRWLRQLPTSGHTTTLTKEQLRQIPVPSPAQCDFGQIVALVDRASTLAYEARGRLERIRGSVGLLLEYAPTSDLPQPHLWLSDLAILHGWCWQDVRRYWLRHQAQWRVRGLQPLHDVIDLTFYRAKTVGGGQPGVVLETNDLRPDWYLARPELAERHESASTPTRTAPATQRFFAIHGECLLIPTVGDILAAPVVIPDEVFSDTTVPLLVSIHWLPLVGLRYPRALAVVLDHPFVRLQRQLSAAFSTVPHLTRDDIASLLMPTVAEDQWETWEQELRQAHSLFSAAAAQVKQVVAMVEEWYT